MNFNKFESLKNYLKTLKKQGICLAFSGGIDSILLLNLCKDLDVVAITFKSQFQQKREMEFAKKYCKLLNIKHKIITFDVFKNDLLKINSKDRCYICKKIFFSEIKKFSKERCIIDGTNFDDIDTYRPGLKAVKEFGIISPFVKFKITKKEIRNYAKYLNINLYDKPSTPCLATRFPYNEELSESLLNKIETAENVLSGFGFSECRFRLHNDIARIEIPKKKFKKFINMQDRLLRQLSPLKIKYITLDLEGIKSGSMD